jgi:AraC-like DNA-binding protein
MYCSFKIHNISEEIEIIHTNGFDYGTCEHTHSNWVVGVVITGERIIQIGKEVVHVKQGMYYVIKPNCSHVLYKGKVKTEAIVISLKVEKEYKDLSEFDQYRIYSREYRIRKIRNDYGLSPGRLERQQKLKYATKLLLEGCSQSYVAQEAGFYDQAHFCHCFLSLWGITPKEYLLAKSKRLTTASTC